MNRGSIPGFYFDPQKKKYFKVQENHIAPGNAKYARFQVDRERREAKKRKVEERNLRIRQRQTVRRARILNHASASGITLSRELGVRERASDLCARDTFHVSQLQPQCTTIRPCPSTATISAIVPLPVPSHFAIASSHSLSRSTVEVAKWNDSAHGLLDLNTAGLRHLVGFNSSVASMSIAQDSSSHTTLMAVCARRSAFPGNIYVGTVPDEDHTTPRGVYLKLGSDTSSLWCSSLHRNTLQTAVTGTEDVFILNPEGNLVQRLNLRTESRAIAWLDRTTVSYGQHSPDITGGVRLWDVRSSGKALRFSRSKPVTGLTSLDDGVRLIVSDNKRTDLYDTRMNTTPTLSFAHVHQGPQLQSALFGQHVFAALDARNTVQTYSLRSGRSTGLLIPPTKELLSNLISSEGTHGPVLYAAQSDTLVQWAWACAHDAAE